MVAAIAVAAFAATVIVLTGALGGARRDPVRVIPAIELEPEDGGWLTVDQLASELDVRPSEVTALVERRAVPFFLVAGASRADPAAYRFRRDEIDAWTIG